MRQRFIALILALTICHSGFAVAYLLRFPAWRAPDEGAHFAYIQHLYRTGALPVFYGKYEGTYEAHQPPLYYLTALLFVAPFLRGEEMPLTALYVARGVSAFWGAVVVVATFLLTWLLFASSPSLAPRPPSLYPSALPAATLAAFFAALLPMHLLVCASVGNDAIAGAMTALTLLWLCWMSTSVAAPSTRLWRDAAVAGILSGFALLAKSSNIILLPLAAIGVLLKACETLSPLTSLQKGKKRTSQKSHLSPKLALAWKPLLAFAIAYLLVAGWWLGRNTALYGDPLAVQAFLEGFRDSPKPADFLEPGGRYALNGPMPLTTYLMWVAQITLFTWLGVFGEPNEAVKGLARLLEGTEPSWHWVLFATLIGAICLLAMVLGVVETVRRSRQALKERQWYGAFVHLLPSLLLLLVFLSFVQFNRHFFQAQARYFYPAHAAMAYLFALGVFRFVPERWGWAVTVGGAAVLLFLATLVWWQWAALTP